MSPGPFQKEHSLRTVFFRGYVSFRESKRDKSYIHHTPVGYMITFGICKNTYATAFGGPLIGKIMVFSFNLVDMGARGGKLAQVQKWFEAFGW